MIDERLGPLWHERVDGRMGNIMQSIQRKDDRAKDLLQHGWGPAVSAFGFKVYQLWGTLVLYVVLCVRYLLAKLPNRR